MSQPHIPLTPAKAGGQCFKHRIRKFWIPAFAGMSGLLLSSCIGENLFLGEPTLSIEMKGDLITELNGLPVGVEVGQTERQFEDALVDLGYADEPSIATITIPEVKESDCGAGSPTLLKTYVRNGVYEDQTVEFHTKAYFSDKLKDDGKCFYIVKTVQPIEMRKPSYLQEISNVKNQ